MSNTSALPQYPSQRVPSSGGVNERHFSCLLCSRARIAVAAEVLRAGVSAEGRTHIFTPNHHAYVFNLFLTGTSLFLLGTANIS